MAKLLTGIVSSDVANKTITVSVASRETHPIYRKQYTITRKYLAHDEDNIAKKGDRVIISETRPFSKRKSFKLDSIIEKSHGSIQLKDEIIEEVQPIITLKTDKSVDLPKSAKKTVSKTRLAKPSKKATEEQIV